MIFRTIAIDNIAQLPFSKPLPPPPQSLTVISVFQTHKKIPTVLYMQLLVFFAKLIDAKVNMTILLAVFYTIFSIGTAVHSVHHYSPVST